jgi:hypothetical protein
MFEARAPERIPADAQVEIEAKKAAGYYALESPTRTDLEIAKGRALADYERS